MSNYWANPTDQTVPCRCGCGRGASAYEKGLTAGFATQDCYDEALNKSYQKDLDPEGKAAKYSFRDVQQGKDANDSELTQEEHNRRQLRQKAAKLEMLGFTGEAQRVREKII